MPDFFALGLIGYPLGHSVSPALHRAALASAGLRGDYQLFEIPPLPQGEAALGGLLASVRRGELHGLNVTIPHKQTLLPFMDEVTPAARSIGAVNCVFCLDERLTGDNTDAAGFRADLESFLAECDHPIRCKHALVLGAGGSARAVVYALLTGGWTVSIAARRVEQAKALAHTIAPGQVEAVSLDADDLCAASAVELVVNTTPLGMHPHTAASPWPVEISLPQGAAVYDLVYNPPQTALIRAAQAAGLPARSGLGMLVEQAALSFERWTGCFADRLAMFGAAAPQLSTKGDA